MRSDCLIRLRATPVHACRQALREKASLWTTPGRQPPLFFFARDEGLAYINKARLVIPLLRTCCFMSDPSMPLHVSWVQPLQGGRPACWPGGWVRAMARMSLFPLHALRIMHAVRCHCSLPTCMANDHVNPVHAPQMEKECEFALDLGVRFAEPQQPGSSKEEGEEGVLETNALAAGPAGASRRRRQRRRMAAQEQALLGARGDAALVGAAGARACARLIRQLMCKCRRAWHRRSRCRRRAYMLGE
jgi:hypothetical protein